MGKIENGLGVGIIGAVCTGLVGTLGNMGMRIVSKKYPLAGTAIAAGTFGLSLVFSQMTCEFIRNDKISDIYLIVLPLLGTLFLAPRAAKAISQYSMSYYESGAYAIGGLVVTAFIFM